MRAAVISGLALVGVGYAAAVVGNARPLSSLDPKALKTILPENVQWAPVEGAPGAEAATLVGNPGQQDLYIQLARFSPGVFSPPTSTTMTAT